MSASPYKIRISSLGLTVACNASVYLQANTPELSETEEEAEGTAAHLMAMWAAQGRLLSVGEKFHSGARQWEATTEMHVGARQYAAECGLPTHALQLEHPVQAKRIHDTECGGTLDARRFTVDGTGPAQVPVLRMIDYKFGHRYVEVFENFQLIGYAVGTMEEMALLDENLIIEFVLVQPRAYHREGPIRKWRVRANELRALVNIAFNAAHAALGENPTATTGRHCLDCRARHGCNTLRYSTANIVDYSSRAQLHIPDDTAVGQELRILDAALKRLEARRTGLAAEAEARIRSGRSVPFYELVPGRANMKWMDNTDIESVAMMGDLFNIPIRKPLAIFTPRQAIDAGIDEKIIMQYAERPNGALSLKQTSTLNTRKALAGATNT